MQTRQLRRAAERKASKEARKHQDAPVTAQPAEASPPRAEINRENAQHSTGPRTEEGKGASSRNSFKHGLYSTALIYPGENPAKLDALKADLRAEHQPANTTEEILVNEMAEQFWRTRRWREREARLMSCEEGEAEAIAFLKILPLIQRLMSTAERAFHKALTALRQLQKDRGFVPHFSEMANASAAETAETALAATKTTAPGAGFVPQTGPGIDPELLRNYSPETVAWFQNAVAYGDFAPDDIAMLDLYEADLQASIEWTNSQLEKAA